MENLIMKVIQKFKEDKLVAIAYSGLVISILSAFTTIVSYTNSRGTHRTFNLFDFLSDASGFGAFVFNEYTGKVIVHYESSQLFLLITLGAAAIICAFVGLQRLSRQTDNKVSFILTLCGLVGTMAPSVIIFVCIVALKDYYLGVISCGIYPIISPIAMIACIAAAA